MPGILQDAVRDDPPEHLAKFYGSGMVSPTSPKGRGSCSNPGSTEWVNGLAQQDWFTRKDHADRA